MQKETKRLLKLLEKYAVIYNDSDEIICIVDMDRETLFDSTGEMVLCDLCGEQLRYYSGDVRCDNRNCDGH